MSFFWVSTIVLVTGPFFCTPVASGILKSNTNKPTYHLLFVGNSLTYSNNLPLMVEKEARSLGFQITTEMLTRPNYAIIDHWKEGHVQQLVQSGKYDFVVIQQGPSSQQDGYDMLVYDGRKFADLCKWNNVKLAYFMVWPSRQYYHTFDGVIANYSAGAEINGAILCPVGKVWKTHFDATGDFSYYGNDGFHPSPSGSKVAAQVIVRSLFTE